MFHDIIINMKKMLTKHFNIKNMCMADVVLEIKTFKTLDGIVLSQSHYTKVYLINLMYMRKL